MFKKIKFKFIALNMTIITIFMVVTFGVIYFMTANSIATKIMLSLTAIFHL
ncbi:hypothetical protein [endosymbiont 'TC1' of Trimyema compressum]|uniref:hypothetical protein n=1 Tax=endosymbiont 'TC1' of Trimyema compressum TaxID=243899 RepID=UPI00139234A3|nr:hypothetical protein [endosymbiont 'TC1' of Trimyema compressum]